jgi:hypothetical protein
VGADGASTEVSSAGVACWEEAVGVAAQSTAWRETFSASAAAAAEDEHGVCVVVVVVAQGVCIPPIGAARTALRLPAARTQVATVLKCMFLVVIVARSEGMC